MWAGWQAWRNGPEARTKIARGAKSRPPGPRPGMDLDDLRHRIRWGNVGRAGALLAAVALVALWPQLRSSPPALPEPRAVPAAPPTSAPRAPRPVRTVPAQTSRQRRRVAPQHAPRPHRRTRRHRRHRRRSPARTVATAKAPASYSQPMPRWTPPPPTAATEFGPG